jgi:DNA polymerase III delta subunit
MGLLAWIASYRARRGRSHRSPPRSHRLGMSAPTTNLAYFWGEDAYAIERAIRRMAAVLGGAVDLGSAADGPRSLDVWRVDAEAETAGLGTGKAARLLERVAERLGTAPLFGGGTLIVIRQPIALLREKASREQLDGLIRDVPPGNALAIAELVDGGSRRPKSTDALRLSVSEAGGIVREYPALTRERMERWLGERAAELDVTLGPGAARLLAERVGAFVREGDVDRRRQTELANGELEKLALLRPGGIASREDVAESMPESIPGSAWAFLDAVGLRHTADGSRIAERLLDGGTPMPVLLAQLHRRLRELIVVRDHQASGTRPQDLVRELKLQPFRAQKLAEQSSTWSPVELERALEGLLELDLASKGIGLDGVLRSMSDARSALGLQAWLAGSVARGR